MRVLATSAFRVKGLEKPIALGVYSGTLEQASGLQREISDCVDSDARCAREACLAFVESVEGSIMSGSGGDD